VKDYTSYIAASYALTALAFLWMSLDTAIGWRRAREKTVKKKKG